MIFPTRAFLCASISLFVFSVEAATTHSHDHSSSTNGNTTYDTTADGSTAHSTTADGSTAHTTAAGGDTAHGAAHGTPKGVNHGPAGGAAPSAQDYMVPRKLPLMDFTLPQTYAGLIDVSESPSQTNSLFFWFVPTENPAGKKDLALWSNGGPGCSSLLGAFQENGPVMWDEGKKTPIVNPNSWHTQANMLYLEHPAGVGFSRGSAVIENENQVARYIFKFLQKFVEIFPEMRGLNFYLTGESYAGMYVSFAADYLYHNQAALALKLQGILLVDPSLSLDAFQTDAPTFRFIQKWNDKYLHLNASFVEKMEALDEFCGGSKYIEKFMKFPPPKFLVPKNLFNDSNCGLWGKMSEALPPPFNIYNIADPQKKFDFATAQPSYFDRPDVRKALNAETGSPKWVECSDAANIFPRGDFSDFPVRRALPNVIQKSKRTVIMHGQLDGRLLQEGMTLSIQGFKWNGKYGFANPVNRPFNVGGSPKGSYQSERGLTYIQVDGAGHMIPHDQPVVALSIFEFLLGRRANV